MVMTYRRLANVAPKAVREILLTLGALAGVGCAGFALTSALFGLTPLVVTSGSMAPTMDTGAVAITRTVDADKLTVGDVVSVMSTNDTRVTHRVEAITAEGGARALTLRGDANRASDPQPYTVSDADRVVFSANNVGYGLVWLTSPGGLLATGAIVAMLLILAFWPAAEERSRLQTRTGSHLAAARGIALVSVIGLGTAYGAVSVADTRAAWTDIATAKSGSFTAMTVPPPTNPTCKTSRGHPTTATASWTSAGPGYRYRLVTRKTSGQVIHDVTIADTSHLYTAALLGNAFSTNVKVTISAYPASVPSWLSPTSVTQDLRIKNRGAGVGCNP